ncbi:MAG TPA: hypothetical protein VNO30_09735 [Kofleriaceae bacterium]|nr:hypothetical protein [Kofleriaceae bacterium]
MRYPALLAMFLVLISGCMFVFDGREGDDDCLLAEPALAPAPLRNPETLRCESFGGGGGCDPACGPCPALDLAPIPSWGSCGSSCEALSESACASTVGCRVVKDAACAVSGTCTSDFLGCFPTDQGTITDLGCFDAHDGWACSQIPDCVAYHRISGATSGFTSPERLLPFAMCAPEGKSPGSCYAAVTCDRAAPACPTQTTPGIANGCYTGGCIPTDLCGPVPQQ